MSILFGRWNFDGTAVAPEYIQKVRSVLATQNAQSATTFVKGPLAIIYAAFHLTEQPQHDLQPAVSPAGTFLAWDGCLDNRSELIGAAGVCPDATDLQIVTSVWDRDGVRCLPQLKGDWALSVFHYYERTLILAKDFLGARPLYYLRTPRYVAWSSLLSPLVLLHQERFTLSEQYVAGWLAGFPEPWLTPYAQILAVPPACSVRITPSKTSATRYFEFQPQRAEVQCSDAEYEERFRHFFIQAVRCRLRARGPVIAELSGGMDSSSIVCVADQIAQTEGLRPVETVSFYDDSEPSWNERPYFEAVEAQRNRTGLHINVAPDGQFVPERDGDFPVTPACGARQSRAEADFSRLLASGGYRVLLSGVGGDEFTGGVPTGIPELADLLRSGNFREFLRQALSWSLASRTPLVNLLPRVIRPFLPALWRSASAKPWPMPWLTTSFALRNQRTLRALASRFRYFGPVPSFQENLHAIERLRRQIACAELSQPGCDKRYPFLDRDLLEFLFNVPREQLVRPKQRRSLLRRAMRGIVPDLVLDRPRKAFVVSNPLRMIASDWERISRLTDRMILESRGILKPALLRQTLGAARQGSDVPLLPATRALRLEWWLRDSHIECLFEAGFRKSNKSLQIEIPPADHA